MLIAFRLNIEGHTFYQWQLATSISRKIARALILFLINLYIIHLTYTSTLSIVIIRLYNYILDKRIRGGIIGIGQYNQMAYIEDSISQQVIAANCYNGYQSSPQQNWSTYLLRHLPQSSIGLRKDTGKVSKLDIDQGICYLCPLYITKGIITQMFAYRRLQTYNLYSKGNL